MRETLPDKPIPCIEEDSLRIKGNVRLRQNTGGAVLVTLPVHKVNKLKLEGATRLKGCGLQDPV